MHQQAAIDVKKEDFTAAHQIVDLYNKAQTTDKEKHYLERVIHYILSAFQKETFKTPEIVSQLMNFGDIQNDNLYRGLINILADVVASEILLNKAALGLLTYLLWNREPVCITSAEFDRLLDIVTAKLELNEDSLTWYGQLLDAMVDTGVTGINKAKLDALLKKLKEIVKVAKDRKDETLIYKARYNRQAALRLKSDERRADMQKRKAYAFFLGVVHLGAAATSIAGAAATFGAGAGLAVPGAILSITEAVDKFKVAFHRKPKKGWYRELRDLEATILGQLLTKKDYKRNDYKQLETDLTNLIKENYPRDIKLGLMEILGSLVPVQSDGKVREILLKAIRSYYAATDEKVKEQVVPTLVAITVRANKEIADDISDWVISEFNEAAINYEALLAQAKGSSSAARKEASINLIVSGQKKAKKEAETITVSTSTTATSTTSSSGGEQTTTRVVHKSIVVAKGGEVEGDVESTYTEEEGPSSEIPPGTSEEDIKRLKMLMADDGERAEKAREQRAKIDYERVVVDTGGKVTGNVTNKEHGYKAGTHKISALAGKEMEKRHKKEKAAKKEKTTAKEERTEEKKEDKKKEVIAPTPTKSK